MYINNVQKQKEQYRMKKLTFLLIVLAVCIWTGCQKDPSTNTTATTTSQDSLVTNPHDTTGHDPYDQQWAKNRLDSLLKFGTSIDPDTFRNGRSNHGCDCGNWTTLLHDPHGTLHFNQYKEMKAKRSDFSHGNHVRVNGYSSNGAHYTLIAYAKNANGTSQFITHRYSGNDPFQHICLTEAELSNVDPNKDIYFLLAPTNIFYPVDYSMRFMQRGADCEYMLPYDPQDLPHVYQKYVPIGYDNLANYARAQSNCSYPYFIPNNGHATPSTNICVVASYMMARHFVAESGSMFKLDNRTDIYKSMLLARTMIRMVVIRGNLSNFGNFSIEDAKNVATGNIYHKGDFTDNWDSQPSTSTCYPLYNDCNNDGQFGNGDNCNAEIKSTHNANDALEIVVEAIRNGFPLVCGVNVGGNASNNNYLNGSYPHVVTIVGVTKGDDLQSSKIHWLDPLFTDQVVYEAPASIFLQSVFNNSTDTSPYDFAVIKGKQ